MKKSRIILLLIVAAAIIAFFILDLGSYLSLDFFKEQRAAIETHHAEHPLQTASIYFLLYVAITALSLPGAVPMTLAGGAIFGLLEATILISFASTLGATLAFLASRFLFRDAIQDRFGDKLTAIDSGIEKEGAFYLFTLRLVPLFPFFMINLLMGLTKLGTFTFYWISQVGMLPGTLVYVNAGVQLGQLDTLKGILSPGLLISFALLGLFPLLAKKMVDLFKARKVYAPYPRPKRFDRNLVVIGAGSAGLVSAYIAAAVKAKVTLIEKHRMGGDCLNTGCVPSKALIRSAKFLSHARRAKEFGFKSATVAFDFAEVMERVQRVIKRVEPHDSVQRYESLGVECIRGAARITSPFTVAVNGRTLTTRSIIIATGARPLIPPVPGIEAMDYLTSDTIWDIRTRPKRLLVLGGGPIGCELSQTFARLGSQVTQVQRGPFLMKREDPEISEMVMAQFRREGIDVRVKHAAQSFLVENGEKTLICENEGREVRLPFDTLLVAVGRKPNVSGFGLEELGIDLDPDGTIATDAYLACKYPNMYACGDVAGPFQFTHTAAHQAWYAAVNGLFGPFKRFKADYSVIPWATFTEPEVARVGLNERDAKAKNIPYEVTTYGIDDLDRAIADGEAHGLVKVLTAPGKDRILGATIVGEHAGDLIAEYVAAMRHGFGMNKILGTIHIYPTLAEANKFAAGNWKKAHQPHTLLEWVRRFHRWRL